MTWQLILGIPALIWLVIYLGGGAALSFASFFASPLLLWGLAIWALVFITRGKKR